MYIWPKINLWRLLLKIFIKSNNIFKHNLIVILMSIIIICTEASQLLLHSTIFYKQNHLLLLLIQKDLQHWRPHVQFLPVHTFEVLMLLWSIRQATILQNLKLKFANSPKDFPEPLEDLPLITTAQLQSWKKLGGAAIMQAKQGYF